MQPSREPENVLDEEHDYDSSRKSISKGEYMRPVADIQEIRAWLQDELVRLENEITVMLPERKANYSWGKKVGRITLCKELLAKLEGAA